MTKLATAGSDRLAQDTGLAAGDLAARRRSEGVRVAASVSSPEDVVALVDREIESLVRGLLADARPEDGFFVEESAATPGTSGLTWAVDPIGDTVNYLYGFPAWAVSIAFVEGDPYPAGWTTLTGAVYNPTGRESTCSWQVPLTSTGSVNLSWRSFLRNSWPTVERRRLNRFEQDGYP